MDSAALLEVEPDACSDAATSSAPAVEEQFGGVDQSVEAVGGGSGEKVDSSVQDGPAASPQRAGARGTVSFSLPGPALPTDSTGIREEGTNAPWLTKHRRPLIGLAALCPLALLTVLVSWLGVASLDNSAEGPSPVAPPGPPASPEPEPEPGPEPEPQPGPDAVMGAWASSPITVAAESAYATIVHWM